MVIVSVHAALSAHSIAIMSNSGFVDGYQTCSLYTFSQTPNMSYMDVYYASNIPGGVWNRIVLQVRR